MICQRCQAEIDTRFPRPDGTIQCPVCGLVYQPVVQQNYPVQQPYNARAQNPVPQQTIQNAPRNQRRSPARRSPKKRNSIWIIVIAIAVVAAIGAGIFFITSSKNAPSNDISGAVQAASVSSDASNVMANNEWKNIDLPDVSDTDITIPLFFINGEKLANLPAGTIMGRYSLTQNGEALAKRIVFSKPKIPEEYARFLDERNETYFLFRFTTLEGRIVSETVITVETWYSFLMIIPKSIEFQAGIVTTTQYSGIRIALDTSVLGEDYWYMRSANTFSVEIDPPYGPYLSYLNKDALYDEVSEVLFPVNTSILEEIKQKLQ